MAKKRGTSGQKLRNSDLLKVFAIRQPTAGELSRVKREMNAPPPSPAEEERRRAADELLEQQRRIANELVHKAAIAGPQSEHAIPVYDEIIARFKLTSDGEIRRIVSLSFLARCYAFRALDRLTAVADAADDLLDWSSTKSEWEVLPELVETGRRFKSEAIQELGRRAANPQSEVVNYELGDTIRGHPAPSEEVEERNGADAEASTNVQQPDNNTAKQNLVNYFRAMHVPEAQMAQAIVDAERIVILAKIRQCAVWEERPNSTRYLTAPAYLRQTYAFLFSETGQLTHEDLLRDHDPKLVQLVQQYIAQRISRRTSDLGDAEGLIFERKDRRGRPRSNRPAASRKKHSSASAKPR
jgi:hypothetical protein